jgi:hypothetical protein
MPGVAFPDGWGTRPVLCGRVAYSSGEMIMAGAGISPRKAINGYMTPRVLRYGGDANAFRGQVR